MTEHETVYALATGHGTAGIAVIRISGTRADAVLTALTRRALPPIRRASVRRIVDADGAFLDEALTLRFAPGASFTGEAMVEIHCHGGRAVVNAVLSAIRSAGGTRMAEPGEFTLRAFRNGRLDLAQAEALADLLNAETETQRRQAARLMDGALHTQTARWRAALLRALALVEVTIDWADEDVPEAVGPEVGALIRDVSAAMQRELAVANGAARLRSGYEVAILGAPNAGKSSLLNALAGRQAAITSPVAGTTRDVIELRYDLSGLPVVFLDTAGLRTTEDAVESQGVARAVARAEAADLRILLTAPDAPLPASAEAVARRGDLRVRSKADLSTGAADNLLAISAVTGAGLPAMLDGVRTALASLATDVGLVGHLRQQQALQDGVSQLQVALKGLDSKASEEVSEDLRSALRAVERLTGHVGVEDVLGEVFSAFCLGK